MLRRDLGWLLLVAAGCAESPTELPNGDLGIAVQVISSARTGPQVIVIQAKLINESDRPVSLRNGCGPLELDREEPSGWVRFADLRLCFGPSTVLLAARTTLEMEDIRPGVAGRYRLAIVTVDGRETYSEPFFIQ